MRYQVPAEAHKPSGDLDPRLLPYRQDLGDDPDGRMGWDEYFVRNGHPTYVIDQVWRGRSAADPSLTSTA